MSSEQPLDLVNCTEKEKLGEKSNQRIGWLDPDSGWVARTWGARKKWIEVKCFSSFVILHSWVPENRENNGGFGPRLKAIPCASNLIKLNQMLDIVLICVHVEFSNEANVSLMTVSATHNMKPGDLDGKGGVHSRREGDICQWAYMQKTELIRKSRSRCDLGWAGLGKMTCVPRAIMLSSPACSDAKRDKAWTACSDWGLI